MLFPQRRVEVLAFALGVWRYNCPRTLPNRRYEVNLPTQSVGEDVVWLSANSYWKERGHKLCLTQPVLKGCRCIQHAEQDAYMRWLVLNGHTRRHLLFGCVIFSSASDEMLQHSKTKPCEMRSTLYIRILLSISIASGIILPSVFQPLLSAIWQWLRSSGVYRWSAFETLWTVFCYAAIEVPITYVFINHPGLRLIKDKQFGVRTKPKGMRRPSRRGYEALLYVAPLLLMDFAMIKKFAGVSDPKFLAHLCLQSDHASFNKFANSCNLVRQVPLGEMLRTGGYDLSSPNVSQYDHKSTFLVPSFHNFSVASPLQTERALPVEAPTSRGLILELICSLIIYDAVFFLFHLALHKLPVLKNAHLPHHDQQAMHPQVTNHLHVFERLGLVMLANFSLNIIG